MQTARAQEHGSHCRLIGSRELDRTNSYLLPCCDREGWLAHKISDTRNCYRLYTGRRGDSG